MLEERLKPRLSSDVPVTSPTATALTITITAPVVTLKGNQAFANSRDVAAFFWKRHDHVLRDIKALCEGAPACVPSFGWTSVRVPMPRGGFREEPPYDMTKDGFTLLAMGFNGAKALQFKLAYIAAFNELEAKANAAVMVLPGFTNPAAAARAWADEVERSV